MRKLYIIRNSIAYFSLRVMQVLLFIIAILTACGEYKGINDIKVNVLIKLVTITSIALLVLIDKIRIK